MCDTRYGRWILLYWALKSSPNGNTSSSPQLAFLPPSHPLSTSCSLSLSSSVMSPDTPDLSAILDNLYIGKWVLSFRRVASKKWGCVWLPSVIASVLLLQNRCTNIPSSALHTFFLSVRITQRQWRHAKMRSYPWTRPPQTFDAPHIAACPLRIQSTRTSSCISHQLLLSSRTPLNRPLRKAMVTRLRV